MKRYGIILISILLVFAMLLPMAGCTDLNTEVPDDTDGETILETEENKEKETEKKPVKLMNKIYDISSDRQYFRFLGRMQFLTEGVTCDLTASGIEFTGMMEGKVQVFLTCTDETYFTLYIDGVRSPERIYAGRNTKKIEIADFPTAGKHTVKLLKQSEAQRSLAVLESLWIVGYLEDAPANRSKYIEVIGDSITCGYGNLGLSANGADGTALWEDGTQAFPFLTAETLSADVSVVGCSGVGVDKGYTAFSEKEFYPKMSRYRDVSLNYDFSSARVPDLVVINLGTNDAAKGSQKDEFKAGVKELVNIVRTSYGKNIPIVWTYGMMGDGCYQWVEEAFGEIGGETNGLYMVALNNDRTGGGGHPIASAHKTAADTLAAYIESKGLLNNVR